MNQRPFEFACLRTRTQGACLRVAIGLLALGLGTVPQQARAQPAVLHVTASNYAGTIRPTWHVSSRVRADITERNLNRGSEPTNRIRRWVQDDVGCPVGDDAGHYVARVLGGRGNDYRNIFPENLSLNRGRQSQWERRVADYLVNQCTEVRVTVSVDFNPRNRRKTRPVTVQYRSRCIGDLADGAPRSLRTQNWNNNRPIGCP